MSSPAPNSPSWDHSGEPDPAGGAFADTGAPERLTEIWQATWDWMKGLPTAPPKLLGSEISSAPSRAAVGSKLFEESSGDSRPELPPSVILPLAVPQ